MPVAYLVYAVLLLAMASSFPVSYEPLQSIARYTIVIFPVSIGWALLLRGRPRLVRATLLSSGALLAVYSGLWVFWAWIG